MIQLTLYTTAGCHLCELAQKILYDASANHTININPIDVSEDDELVERYGIRIPVVELNDGTEIGWPFTLSDIELLISNR